MTPIALQVAVPPLDRVLLDEAVAAEQLHAVVADLHAALGAQPRASATSRAKRLALRGAGRGAVGHQPHALQLDRDVGDHERHALPVADRLAERLALVDVGHDVVEDGLRRAERTARTRPAGTAARTRGSPRRCPSSARSPTWTSVQHHPGQRRGPQPHRRLGLDLEAGGARLDQEQPRLAVEQRRRPRTARRRHPAAPSTSRR